MSAYFDYIVSRVSRMKAGEDITVDAMRLGEGWGGFLGEFLSNGWKPPDRVLESVVGSSATHRYLYTRDGNVMFRRVHSELPEGVRSYVSPDRRDYFRIRTDGLYQHHETKLTHEDEGRIRCALNGHHWEPRWFNPPFQVMANFDASAECLSQTVQLIEGQGCTNCRAERRSPDSGKP